MVEGAALGRRCDGAGPFHGGQLGRDGAQRGGGLGGGLLGMGQRLAGSGASPPGRGVPSWTSSSARLASASASRRMGSRAADPAGGSRTGGGRAAGSGWRCSATSFRTEPVVQNTNAAVTAIAVKPPIVVNSSACTAS